MCWSININLLTKQHFPLLWLKCMGVYWMLELPSKSWAYWGNPAARSQSHASFASISETQQSACLRNGDSKWNSTTLRFRFRWRFNFEKPWENKPKQQKPLCTWRPVNTTDWEILNLKPAPSDVFIRQHTCDDDPAVQPDWRYHSISHEATRHLI